MRQRDRFLSIFIQGDRALKYKFFLLAIPKISNFDFLSDCFIFKSGN